MFRAIIDKCCGQTPKEKPFPKIVQHRETGTIAIALLGDTQILRANCRRLAILRPGENANTMRGELLEITFHHYDKYWKDYNEPITLQNE